ncbi:MAG: hypothetical protein JKY67_00805 [Pseudomonadales bacterium]|nr:hypothetical protein [Pseudomonadales bacterium]
MKVQSSPFLLLTDSPSPEISENCLLADRPLPIPPFFQLVFAGLALIEMLQHWEWL